jgi:hypothetical protein
VDFRVLRVLEMKLSQLIEEDARLRTTKNEQQTERIFNRIPQLRPPCLVSNVDYQQRLVDMTLRLLADSDHRVRTQAAKTLVKLLPRLCINSSLTSNTSPLLSLLPSFTSIISKRSVRLFVCLFVCLFCLFHTLLNLVHKNILILLIFRNSFFLFNYNLIDLFYAAFL